MVLAATTLTPALSSTCNFSPDIAPVFYVELFCLFLIRGLARVPPTLPLKKSYHRPATDQRIMSSKQIKM
jgi:hypothetical protein